MLGLAAEPADGGGRVVQVAERDGAGSCSPGSGLLAPVLTVWSRDEEVRVDLER